MISTRLIEVSITDDTLTVDLEDGRIISIPVGWYPRLAHGTPEECANFKISGAGHGIHWPDLDEDIGIEGLLLGKKSAESPASFAMWLEGRAENQTFTSEPEATLPSERVRLEDIDHPLRGTLLKYDDPCEPIAVEDWHALQ